MDSEGMEGIGFIRLGIMGCPMAFRIQDGGHRLHAWPADHERGDVRKF
jgi:3-hydroxyisobutyrate dehydrogenase-like beta-hydroxyacid dehydrogenase